MNFRALVRLDGKTATGIEVPEKVLTSLNGGRRPRVRVTINDYTYRTSVGSMGGRSLLPVSQDTRTRAGIQAGDAVTVEIELDTEPRNVTVPDDLASALAKAGGRDVFERLSYSVKHRHVYAVDQAKTPETRRRRVEKMVSEVLAGSAALR